jgi:beta-glucosidase
MSAYNTINGITASEHPLLNDVLRNEFGFDGVVISDWHGTYSPGVVASGLDLEMPGPAQWMTADHVRAALAEGSIEEPVIDEKVRRILTLLERTGARHRTEPPPEQAVELAEHRALARGLAHESMVLLKNDALLPVTGPMRIAVIGELAAATPNQGGGSSGVNPHRVVSILEGLREGAPEGTVVTWSPGVHAHRYPPAFEPQAIVHDDGATGFRVEYYAGPEFEGEPVRTASTTRSFLVFLGSRDAWVDHEAFSVRVSGRFRASQTGRHAFAVSAGGRVRVSVDGTVVVDAWEGDATQGRHWEADLGNGDEIDLVVEYGSRPGERHRWLSMGCETPESVGSIHDAAVAAAEAELAVVVVGLTPEWESEGFDRQDLTLPGEQARLIEAVSEAQPNTVVVITAGSSVEMPWLERPGAVLHAWYGGQEVGHAVADVLFGMVDPGGRLPVTFPRDSKQHPGMLNYPGEAGEVRYGEGVYVGYRGFDKLGLEPMFPFGHGLSYTTFVLSDAGLESSDDRVVLSGGLANTGSRDGIEVVQVFARDIGGVDRRLVGFSKQRLAAGTSAPVEIAIPTDRLRWWDPVSRAWAAAEGVIEFEVKGTFGTEVVTATL